MGSRFFHWCGCCFLYYGSCFLSGESLAPAASYDKKSSKEEVAVCGWEQIQEASPKGFPQAVLSPRVTSLEVLVQSCKDVAVCILPGDECRKSSPVRELPWLVGGMLDRHIGEDIQGETRRPWTKIQCVLLELDALASNNSRQKDCIPASRANHRRRGRQLSWSGKGEAAAGSSQVSFGRYSIRRRKS